MDLFIILIITAFIIIACWITIRYALRVRNSYNGISDSAKQVSDYLNLLSDDEEKNGNTTTLLQLVDETIVNYPILAEPWEMFKKKLSKDKKHALVSSGEYFSRDKLINLNTKNRDRIKALPGILTAWGLLGTFVAILLGLTGIDPNNIATINHLVHGLYGKFSSSIAALFCSIAFVFYERGLYSNVGVSCNNLQKALDNLFPTLASNEILSNLESSIEAQAETINTLSKSLAQNSLESIEKMVNLFRETLTEGTAEQFRNISEIISDLADTLRELQCSQDLYIDRMNDMNSNAELLIKQHREDFKSITEIIEQINSKVEIFRSTMEKSKEICEKLYQTTAELGQVSSQASTFLPSINDNNQYIKQLNEDLNKSIEFFNKVTNELSDSKMDVVIQEFKDGIKASLTDIQNGLNDDLSIIKDGYQWHETQLDKLVEAATNNIDKIHSSMNDYTEKTSNFLANYDESIAKAISYLNTNVHTMDNSLKDNIKTLENNFSDLNKTLENINNKMRNEG